MKHQHSAAPWGITYPGEPKDMTSATYDANITMIGVSVQDKKITTADLIDLFYDGIHNAFLLFNICMNSCG